MLSSKFISIKFHVVRFDPSLHMLELFFGVWILTLTQVSKPLRGGTVPTCAEVEDWSSKMMRLYATAQEVQGLSEDTERASLK